MLSFCWSFKNLFIVFLQCKLHETRDLVCVIYYLALSRHSVNFAQTMDDADKIKLEKVQFVTQDEYLKQKYVQMLKEVSNI